MGQGALGSGILKPGAFAGPAAPLLILFALYKMPLPHPASSPRLTWCPFQEVPLYQYPVRVRVLCASAPPISPLHWAAPLTSPC